MAIRKKQERKGPIVIDLTGPDGNAFVLLGMANRWAKQLGKEKDWDDIYKRATSGDYENLLQVLDGEFGDYVIFER